MVAGDGITVFVETRKVQCEPPSLSIKISQSVQPVIDCFAGGIVHDVLSHRTKRALIGVLVTATVNIAFESMTRFPLISNTDEDATFVNPSVPPDATVTGVGEVPVWDDTCSVEPVS